MPNDTDWVGFDLDGVLAATVATDGSIGPPVWPMMDLLRQFLSAGRPVRIFTARAEWPGQVVLVQDWLETNGLPRLPVTNVKDSRCLLLFDDRAVSVANNTGSITTTDARLMASVAAMLGV